jgi:histone deacetylase 6
LTTQMLSGSLIRAAIKWNQMERHKKALMCIEKALCQDPNNAKVHFIKGKILHKLQHYKLAIKSLEQSISLAPNYESAYIMKGVVLYDSGYHEEAFEWYAKVISSRKDFKIASNEKLINFIRDRKIRKLKRGSQTGIVYDVRMTEHRDPYDDDHPECPERLLSIMNAITKSGYDQVCRKVTPRVATKEELLLVHTKELVDAVIESKLEDLPSDNFVNEYTSQAALLAAGSLIELTERVVTGRLDNGFAIIRPPGHHANEGEASGFCFFNNVAVAARVMQKKHNIQRVLIVDWDVHHGNGTQDIFENDESILFFSSHRGEFYPNSGQVHDVGVGNIINVPFTNGTYSDGDIIRVFSSILMPIATEFQPELVIVSAGFDAVEYDPLGEMNLSPQVFGHLTHMLKSLAGGKLVLALEGGYNLQQIPKCVIECLKVLKGSAPSPLPQGTDPLVNARHYNVLFDVYTRHLTKWKSLYMGPDVALDH